MISDEFDTRLKFNQVVYSSNPEVLTETAYIHNMSNDADGDGYAEKHSYLSFSDGFDLDPNEDHILVLEFIIDNAIGT